ncbi:MAG: YfhO family protein [Coprobacillus sp.]|nr:YfhO family protein [Coprobacillus sp.]
MEQAIEQKTENTKKPGWFRRHFSFLFSIKSLFYYFIFLLILAVLFYITILVANDFTTPFTGDYVSQQLAFFPNGWDDWWHFFKTGEFVLWDTNTFLGASNIGSNSFYYLFNPFFLPILLCPRDYIAQGMAVLEIVKMACAGMSFYAYMRYMGASKTASKIVGIAYAFSGWIVWYLWFNVFTEVAIVFPLMLYGVEKALKEKKPWLLAFSIFLMGVTNFYFMICFTIVLFLYAMFRWFQLLPKHKAGYNFAVLGIGIGGAIIGLLMSCVIVLPSALVAVTTNRGSGTTYLSNLLTAFQEGNWSSAFSLLFSWSNVDSGLGARNFYAIIEFFFPVMSDRGTPLTKYGNETYDNIAGGLFCFYPMIIFLIPAFIYAGRKHKVAPFIGLLCILLMLFSPFFYYLFFGFTVAYSRWYLIVVTSMLSFVGLYLDHIKEVPRTDIIFGVLFTIIGIIAATLLAQYIVDNYSGFTERNSIFTAYIIALVYVIILGTILIVFKNKKAINIIITIFLSLEVCVMGALTIDGHGYTSYESANGGLAQNQALYSLVMDIQEDDPTYYRCYSSLENDDGKNDGMRNNYNGLGFFHSIFDYELRDFLNWSRFTSADDSWSGTYVEKRQNLDTFLGVKYYFIEKDKVVEDPDGYLEANVPLDFVDISDKYPNDYFYVYENTNFIDFAFSYDNVTPVNNEEDPDATLSGANIDALRNEELYLKTGLLDYQDVEEIIRDTNGAITESTVYSTSEADFTNIPINYLDAPVDGKEVTTYNGSGIISHIYKTEKRAYDLTLDEIKDLHVTNEREDLRIDKPGSSDGSYIVFFYEMAKGNPIGSTLNEDGSWTSDEGGVCLYLYAPFQNSYKVDVYLIDYDGNFITYDRHNDDHTTNNRKSMRAFYSRAERDEEGNIISPAREIQYLVIIPRYYGISSYSLYYETYSTFKETTDVLQEYPVENVQYSTNKFEFTTNYDSQRFVVTQIPYDAGWSVKATNSEGETKDLKVYKAQGGFVGFVAEEGYTEYKMTYYTPYLRLGTYMSIAGTFIFVTSFASYYYMSWKHLMGTTKLEEFDITKNKKKKTTRS